MAHSSALDTLLDLARRATDDAAKRLGAAVQAVEEARQKLEMLHGYRDDYAHKLDAAQLRGMTPMAYQNFVAFMAKLDKAIQGQRDLLVHAEARAAHEKAAWQAAERKRLSYSTLSQRAAEEALRLENKRDQKLMDEHATRQAYYRR
jgi:flagellar FliJ protein